MSNPTTPFSWQMPTNTDLVTDLPADFEVFGQAVASSMADLLGGTTGQILSKATNADMDFTWITNDVGDITAVTATSPLTGGGTSGAITVGIQASSTTQSGAVQLTDSTSSTSTTTAATPNSVKTSYDLAVAAIPKSTVTTAGDVIYATGSGAVTRLGIGTAGQVLTVNGGATAPSWTSPASGGMTLITSGNLAGSSVNIGSIPQTYTQIYLVIKNWLPTSANTNLLATFNSDTNTRYATEIQNATSYAFSATSARVSQGSSSSVANGIFTCLLPDYANTTSWKYMTINGFSNNNATTTSINTTFWTSAYNQTTAISSIQLFPAAGTFTGTYFVYGVK
jgi:hypothetical protein